MGAVMPKTQSNRRFSFDMSVADIINTMAENNVGAIICCSELLRINDRVDPDDIGGAVGAIVKLDRMGIYGTKLGMLWGDVCRSHAGIVIAVVRAEQLHLAGVTEESIHHAINNRGDGLDIDAIIKAVQQRLPNFNLNAT